MKNPRKRLTSTYFMNRYRHFLVDGGIIHLKTDSNFLFTYTTYMVDGNHLPVLFRTEDLYHREGIDEETRKILSIQTYYESMWIERGLNIKYQKFALPREGELVEPILRFRWMIIAVIAVISEAQRIQRSKLSQCILKPHNSCCAVFNGNSY